MQLFEDIEAKKEPLNDKDRTDRSFPPRATRLPDCRGDVGYALGLVWSPKR